MSVLEVRDLAIRFGGLQALQGLNLQVNEYEIVGLIGPNGAGKTTAFNCITGFYQPNSGQVLYRGQDVTQAPPHIKAGMGFGRTFQNVGMVKSATALENLKTAQHAKVGYTAASGLIGAPSSFLVERRLKARAEAILDLLGLADIRDQQVGGQSYGTLKLLELGCALATDPDILLLDEPTSGMGPEESDELGERLLTLRREFALTMLVIEHHVPLVLRVCDHVYVLNFGRLLAEGKPSVIQTHPEVVAAYLGGPAPSAQERAEERLELSSRVGDLDPNEIDPNEIDPNEIDPNDVDPNDVDGPERLRAPRTAPPKRAASRPTAAKSAPATSAPAKSAPPRSAPAVRPSASRPPGVRPVEEPMTEELAVPLRPKKRITPVRKDSSA